MVGETLVSQAEETPSFFRGLNLNGPSVYIDGNRWDGKDADFYVCNDSAFENQNVPLVPTTDPERARMIRSSRYGGNRLELNDVPPGVYTLFLYVWEDNNSETYSVSVNGQKVLEHNSGTAGHWDKLGPWPVTVKNDSKILLTSSGGAANFLRRRNLARELRWTRSADQRRGSGLLRKTYSTAAGRPLL